MFPALLCSFLLFFNLCRGTAVTSTSTTEASSSSDSCSLTSSIDRLAESMARSGGVGGTDLRLAAKTINLEDRLGELQDRVELMRAELDAVKAITGTATTGVYFNAVRQQRASCYGCLLSFDHATADTHSAFDLAAGTFVAPVDGHYFFQFHALVESGSEAQIEILVNDSEAIHLYDRDIGGGNQRYAMVGQGFIRLLQSGDRVAVRMHKGALKGGPDTTFTSFLGMMVGRPAEENNEIEV